MKALTLWQPWASLMAMGEKVVETRVWAPKFRGEIAIHAAHQIPPRWLGASRFEIEFRRELADVFMVPYKHLDKRMRELPRGAVLCIMRLADIQTADQAAGYLSRRELIFGNYSPGRYAWFFEMVEKFETPIVAKGNRLLWNWER